MQTPQQHSFSTCSPTDQQVYNVSQHVIVCLGSRGNEPGMRFFLPCGHATIINNNLVFIVCFHEDVYMQVEK